jgi:hypothetical protein
MKRGITLAVSLVGGVLLIANSLAAPNAHAATRKAALPVTPPPSTSTNFSIQVTPSPLVVTVKPGVKTTQELKIHNGANGSENLKIEPKAFTLSYDGSNVNLLDTAPPDISNWVSFSAPKFTIQANQWFTEEVTFNTPKTAGFSYSFALSISRQTPPTATPGQRVITGSLAVFTLVNVDRPDATSSLQVVKFTSSKRVYEYLPATFSISFQNNGNTITQPLGNIFMQRNATSKTPIDSLNVNSTQGYILPGTTRVITATWDDGFPAYQTVATSDNSSAKKLVWNWANLSRLRIGRYTAHLVAVYNQGGRDVPIEGNVTFWVIPWKILLIPLVIVLLLLFAAFIIIRSMVRGTRRKVTKRKAKKATVAEAEEEADEEEEQPEKPARKPKKAAGAKKTTKAKKTSKPKSDEASEADSDSDED